MNPPSSTSGEKEWIDGRRCESESCNFLTPSEHLIVGIENKRLRTRGFDVIESSSDILRAIELFGKNLHPAGLRRLSNIVKNRGVSGKRTIPHHGDFSRARKCVEQQIQSFSAQCRLTVGNAREITARLCRARDNSKPDRIGHKSEDDRGRHAGFFQRKHSRRRQRDGHIGLAGGYSVDQRVQPPNVPFSTEHFNHRSTAAFMTQRAQGVDQDVNRRTFRKTAVQNADTLFGRKALRGERRKKQSSNKFSPPHSIKRSASPSSCDGTVTPSVFAVPRLMTKVNLVGCSIGRLPGLAPFRILST